MKRISNKSLISFLFIAIPCLAGGNQKIAMAPDGNVYLNLHTKEGYHNIFKYIQASKSLSSFYRISNPDQCHINDFSIDYTGKTIAIFEGCRILSLKDNDKEASAYYLLTVVSVESKTKIASFPHSMTFSFSPKGDAIAYSENYSLEMGIPPGYRGGLWIYNFDTKSMKKIATLGVEPLGDYRPEDISWSEHDGNIYYTNYEKVLRYNVKSGKSEIVPYKGIYFSVDGKYYSSLANEGVPSKIYRTCDNNEMAKWNTMIIEKGSSEYPVMSFRFWSKKYNSAAFCIDPSCIQNALFDVNKGEITGEFAGSIIGTNADGSLVAVNPVKEDNKNTYDQTQVEIINLQEVISKYKSSK